MITADSVVVNVDPRDIPFETFQRVQAERNSPAAPFARAGHDAALQFRVSAAFLVAVFAHESQFATDPNAIVVKFDTKNPGNCRSPRIGNPPIISTPRGQFVKYPTWAAGWADLAWRLVDPDYVYVKEGRRTIRQIIERFAPATDNNVPSAYIAAVVRDMNRWIDEAPMAAQIPGFAWVPETAGEFGYPQGTRGRNGVAVDRLIIHCTIGTDSLAWLTGAHGNSIHFLDNRDGTARAQMLPIADAAWGAGNRAYNLRAVHYEHECTGTEMLNPAYWTDSIINNMARNCAAILRHPECAGITPDREHVIGHVEVPDQDHTDPGPVFPWDRFMAALQRELGSTPPDSGKLVIPGTPGGYGFVAGFRAYVESLGRCRFPQDVNAGIASVVGLPLQDEWAGTDSCSYQRCERGVLQYNPNNAPPFDVVILPIGAMLPERAA